MHLRRQVTMSLKVKTQRRTVGCIVQSVQNQDKRERVSIVRTLVGTNTTYFMGATGAASDYVISGNTFSLANTGYEPVATSIMPARRRVFQSMTSVRE